MAALRPRPFTQGQLDSLCGIYCIINSLAWAFHSLRRGSRSHRRRIRPLNTYECRQLFGTLVTALILRQATGRSATEGITAPDLIDLLRRSASWVAECRELRLTVVRPFHRRLRVPTRQVCDLMAGHLAKPGTSTIIGIEPPWHHWSVVRGASDKRLLLFDSTGNHYLWRSDCGRHCDEYAGLVRPTLVFLLTLESLVKRPRSFS